jgi:deazaflavin-dependent oxidoreductase (nitroreductase family)
MKPVDTRSPSALSRTDRALLFLEYEGNKRLRGLGTSLYRLTAGSLAPRNRNVLLLTTRGRKSGKAHTVLLQFFPDGATMIVVATNSGRPTNPDWFYNLAATPMAQVEIKGRTLQVCATQLSDEEARAFWPRILDCAPTYVRYRTATSRDIPLVRLVPVGQSARAGATEGQ